MDADAALTELQNINQLTILDLAYPILNPSSSSAAKRTSGASDASNQANITPALLAADLAHYRDLFSKLRFSYVEQVTKERLLRAITSDPPEFVESSANAELGEKLKVDKAALKEKKEELQVLIGELEAQGRSLANRYENIQLQSAQLEALPAEIGYLQKTISTLQAQQEPTSSNPALSLPLQPTLDLLADREQQLFDLDHQIALLRAAIPAKRDEVENLKDELVPLQMRKMKAVQEAQEARRRRQDGAEIGDELEERGRWLRGVETGLRRMLEV
ncbi:hypothetical protein LTR91_013913 [Friedmanniomyces endolithicus]|uniref:Kinetochore protein Sos7 coiled-coil domain-containing protein n=1 Tax=Friedmanniomyces endolithicus TaxID=329885 RepID=A0AAN6KCZ1_9PEZI|nr:hypothetical protein LTR94_000051 [Friedmanniomyces endolithicus]KAK0806033.1 hypothetical protein LTR59_003851 [Friedmanniomyces endolithicus]KAK0816228.1 hypothetical protein LTR38_002210 [Friedmanniomyces endolithicus]KAK0818987.1 hypothetical protein LTR75_002443 [Friedmanniomyces endolithicus]KAK0851310.1 hypothetical protein LTR03_004097 [Friedmanniomyces endolithicus]